jgi:hypothetical protein
MKRRKKRRPSAEAEEPVLNINGYLEKKSKRGAWQKRWFFTSHTYLMYAKKKGDTSLGGVDLLAADSRIEPFTCVQKAAISHPAVRVTGLCADEHGGVKGADRATRTFELRESSDVNAANSDALSFDEWIDALQRMREALLARSAQSGVATSDIATAGASTVVVRMEQAHALARGTALPPPLNASNTVASNTVGGTVNGHGDRLPPAIGGTFPGGGTPPLPQDAAISGPPAFSLRGSPSAAPIAEAPVAKAPPPEAPAAAAPTGASTVVMRMEQAHALAQGLPLPPPLDASNTIADGTAANALANQTSVNVKQAAATPLTVCDTEYVSTDPDGSRFDDTPMSPVSPSTPRQPQAPPTPPTPATPKTRPRAPPTPPTPATPKTSGADDASAAPSNRVAALEAEHARALVRAKSEWETEFAARTTAKTAAAVAVALEAARLASLRTQAGVAQVEHDAALAALGAKLVAETAAHTLVVAALRDELETQRLAERAVATRAAGALANEAAMHVVELHTHDEAAHMAEEAAGQCRDDLARAQERAVAAAAEAEELHQRDSAAAESAEQAVRAARSAEGAAAREQARATMLVLDKLRAELATLHATADADQADLERVKAAAAAAAAAAAVAAHVAEAHERDDIAAARAAAARAKEQLSAEAAAAEVEARAAALQLAAARAAMAALEEVNGADHAALERVEAQATAAAADAAEHERVCLSVAAAEYATHCTEATLGAAAEAAAAEAQAAELTLTAMRAEMAALQAEHSSEIARISQHAHDVEGHVGSLERAQLEWESTHAASAAAQTARAVAAATEELQQECSVMRDVIEANRAHDAAERSAQAKAQGADRPGDRRAAAAAPAAGAAATMDASSVTRRRAGPSVRVNRHGSISISAVPVLQLEAGGQHAAALIALPTPTPERERAALVQRGDLPSAVARRNGEDSSRAATARLVSPVLAPRGRPGLVLRQGDAPHALDPEPGPGPDLMLAAPPRRNALALAQFAGGLANASRGSSRADPRRSTSHDGAALRSSELVATYEGELATLRAELASARLAGVNTGVASALPSPLPSAPRVETVLSTPPPRSVFPHYALPVAPPVVRLGDSGGAVVLARKAALFTLERQAWARHERSVEVERDQHAARLMQARAERGKTSPAAISGVSHVREARRGRVWRADSTRPRRSSPVPPLLLHPPRPPPHSPHART